MSAFIWVLAVCQFFVFLSCVIRGAVHVTLNLQLQACTTKLGFHLLGGVLIIIYLFILILTGLEKRRINSLPKLCVGVANFGAQ
jgi:hypothetical protein